MQSAYAATLLATDVGATNRTMTFAARTWSRYTPYDRSAMNVAGFEAKTHVQAELRSRSVAITSTMATA
jgi:hypothetical protein